MKNKKIRMFEIMQYENYYNINNAIDWVKNIDCSYLCVRHDKDQNDIHHHLMCKMTGARSVDDIAKQCNIEPQYINFIKNWNNALAYAFHLTDTSKNEKYIYDKTAIIDSKNIDIDEIFKRNDDYEKYNNLVVESIYQYGRCEISRNELFKKINEKDYNKHYNLIKRMRDYRNELIKERLMRVIYIYGPSGCGKTTLAKFMADTYKYDFFVSGSGSDVLDGYDKEECIILDDLRGDIFKKSELFKLTDNNTNSSVKSRFKNKDISNCKLLIITSIKAPSLLYDWDIEKHIESPKQFARRLDYSALRIDEDGILYQERLNDDLSRNLPKTQQLKELNMKLVYTALKIFSQSPTIKTIYDDLTSEAKKRIEENEKLPF